MTTDQKRRPSEPEADDAAGDMAEFEVERAEQSYLQILHASEGHRYMFLIAETEDGERVIDGGIIMRENHLAERRGAHYAEKVRVFAEREARAAGLID